MVDSGKIFEKLVHLATEKGIVVRFAPLKASCGRIKRNRIAIKQDLPSIDEINYTLAHELAHVYLHYDKGDTMNSPDNKEYEEQADRVAMLILELLTERNENGCQMAF